VTETERERRKTAAAEWFLSLQARIIASFEAL
jgi:hypothetical protein